ncbi:DUF4229 domain-containing protein [Microterricola pindariensis]|uniref:Mechanosensitive ion channel protein MscS n=1 Tax=Microterricola pindariensis TaxID=478010 RepID=A0ABX5ASX6_9MICO|nr:DUF4229 domain-containing protein [Microterricola pindariensis]PPL14627.1 hypothetical protein GY24_15835 [Microterricola pindariensis]
MNKRSWITFTVVRLLAFFVPLIVLLFIQVNPWIATVLAAVIGLCVSFIFFRKPRESVARELYEVRHAEKAPVREDDEVEDAVLDALGETPAAPAAEAPATPEQRQS